MKKILRKAFSILGYTVQKKPGNGVDRDKVKRERFVPYECTFLNHSLYVHDQASFKLGVTELFRDKIYKFKADKQNPYIIDCGANLGMSIIYFKSLYPNAEVIAFEADPYIFSFLQKNVQSFQFADVTLMNNAVWYTSGETLSFLSEGGAGGRLQEKSDEHKFIDVKTIRLKDFLNKEVDFLKIDIEGAEFDVLKDCAEDLKTVKMLFVEYHSFPDKRQNLHFILDIIQNAGFRYHIKEAFTSPEPLMEQLLNVGMDLQLNIFCYRN